MEWGVERGAWRGRGLNGGNITFELCHCMLCVELAAAAKSLHSSKFLFLSIFIFLNNYFFFFSERDEIVRPTIVVIFDSIAIIFSVFYIFLLLFIII